MKFLKWFFDWPILLVESIGLVWISWPVYHHVISFFWISILIVVLIDEIISRFFFPERKTISNNIRQLSKDDPIRFWGINILWLIFACTLVLHFSSKLIGG